MKLGISSYSLDRDMARGDMTLFEVIDWAAREGAQCIELVPFAFKFVDAQTGEINHDFIAKVKRHAADAGMELINYSIHGDLCKEGAELEAEVARLKKEVDVAAELGIKRTRQDVCAFRRPLDENGLVDFEKWLPVIAGGAREVAEHAKAQGVLLLCENHGFFANGCERVERILNMVDHDNYQLLLDTGNIACMDENTTLSARRLAPRAKMVHLKDFYIRQSDPGDSTQFDCAGRWFKSYGGLYLRGAILAQGDLDVYAILSAVKGSGYDGGIVIEFEGLEDAKYATSVSLSNARRIWDEV